LNTDVDGLNETETIACDWRDHWRAKAAKTSFSLQIAHVGARFPKPHLLPRGQVVVKWPRTTPATGGERNNVETAWLTQVAEHGSW
jgi:hypothetical protein